MTPVQNTPKLCIKFIVYVLEAIIYPFSQNLKYPHSTASAVLDAKNTMGKEATYGFHSQGVYIQLTHKQASRQLTMQVGTIL